MIKSPIGSVIGSPFVLPWNETVEAEITNLLLNGTFDSLDAWSVSNGTLVTISNNQLYIEDSGNYANQSPVGGFTETETYYYSVEVVSVTAGALCRFDAGGSNNLVLTDVPGVYTGSFVCTNQYNDVYLRCASGGVGDIAVFKDVKLWQV